MRVLFVIDTMNAGGAEKVLLDTATALRDEFDVSVLALFEYPDDPNLVEQVREVADYRSLFVYKNGSIPRKALNRIWLRTLRHMLRRLPPALLHRLFVGKGFDVEVAFLEGRATRLVSGLRDDGCASYAWIHTDVEENPWIDYYFRNLEEQRSCYRSFDGVMAVSSETAAKAKQRFEVDVRFIQNVVDSSTVIARSQIPHESLRREGELEVVAVGRLEEVKGPDRLLEAVRSCLDAGIPVHATLVGDGSLRTQLEELACSLGIEEAVSFAGYQSNPYGFMADADLVVCPSRAEGFSGTVTEALLLGRPVLTTDCAGMGDLLGDSRWGLVVENSQEGLNAGMQEVLSSPARLAELAELAQVRGRDFSTEALSGAVATLLKDGAASKRGES